MRLGEKQELFARLLPRLLDRAHALGFDVRVGEVERGAEQAAWNATHCRRCRLEEAPHHPGSHAFLPIGIRESVHRKRLAVDLMLFKDGEYITDSVEYKPLGDWWKSQHELCCWGGDFPGDGGHFSLAHEGVK